MNGWFGVVGHINGDGGGGPRRGSLAFFEGAGEHSLEISATGCQDAALSRN